MSLRQGIAVVFTLTALALGGCADAGDPESPEAHAGDEGHENDGQARVTTLLTEPLAGAPGLEARVLTVELAPGSSSPAHRHPGQVFAYVLQGTVLTGLDGQAPVRYTQGQTWSEAPGQVHSASQNESPTAPAKLLVFFVTEPGKPVVEPAP
ncbi:cupin domain-containing protein [Sorangium sp. So ce1078]|uniref:cupin domain-containing protein n=1 Tax=Sorangium sp. So ce1078 TaxID=3133329 RepID=UPI003F60E956